MFSNANGDEDRRPWQVDALGMSRTERAAKQTLSQVVEILFERDFVGIVNGPIEPLVLIVAAGGDPAPSQRRFFLLAN